MSASRRARGSIQQVVSPVWQAIRSFPRPKGRLPTRGVEADTREWSLRRGHTNWSPRSSEDATNGTEFPIPGEDETNGTESPFRARTNGTGIPIPNALTRQEVARQVGLKSQSRSTERGKHSHGAGGTTVRLRRSRPKSNRSHTTPTEGLPEGRPFFCTFHFPDGTRHRSAEDSVEKRSAAQHPGGHRPYRAFGGLSGHYLAETRVVDRPRRNSARIDWC